MLNLLPNNKPVYCDREKRLDSCKLWKGDHYFSDIWYSQNKSICSGGLMAKMFICKTPIHDFQ